MSEWDRRELCPDGGCVGVIGPDGKCGVCGKETAVQASGFGLQASGEHEEPEQAAADDEPSDSGSGSNAGSDSEAGSPRPEPRGLAAAGGEGGDEWDQRQLCPDGACVGVIGDDGTCTVCGRSAA